MTELIAKIIGMASVVVVLVPVFIILGTFLGGCVGWVVGGVFPYVTDTLRELLGVTLTNFQIGATLGFFGSAFRSHNFD